MTQLPEPPAPRQDLLLTAGSVLSGPVLLGCAQLILGSSSQQRLRVMLEIPGVFAAAPPSGGFRPVEELLGLLAAGSGLLLCFLSATSLTAALLHAMLERLRPRPGQGTVRSLWRDLHAISSLLSPAFMRRAAAAVIGAQVTLLGTTGALPGDETPQGHPQGQASALLTAEEPPAEEPELLGARLPAEAPGFPPSAVSAPSPDSHDAQETSMTPLFRPSPPPETGPRSGSSLREDPGESRQVTVRPGDTLWALVAEHLGPETTAWEVAREWPRWHEANRETIGPDPELLRPGNVLTIPEAAQTR